MPTSSMLDNPIPWPENHRCAVAITWDIDAESSLKYRYPDKADSLVATQSMLRYGPRIAIPRLVNALRSLEMSQTFFMPGWVMEHYPATVELLLKNGHEIALHGYLHERSNELSKEQEAELLDKAVAIYRSQVGQQPKGWRAPAFAFSENSAELLMHAGFEYDSSLMGNDIPYVLQLNAHSLIELPTGWHLDDWPYYMHNSDFRYTMPILTPANAMQAFRAEFDAAWEHGSLLITVWHPFLSGRIPRLAEAVKFMEHIRTRGRTWLTRLDEVSAHVKKCMQSGQWQPWLERL